MKGTYLFKTIAVGSGGVGKTSLVRRFAEGTFLETYVPTLGVDFAIKEVQLRDQTIKLVIFDTGGQELFGRLRPYYYRGANGALVCYDITAKATFEALEGWLSEIYHHVGPIPLLLVGTKVDLAAHREVPCTLAEAYAQEKCLHYIETSAKTGLGVEKMFLSITRMMLEASMMDKMTP
ncbi:MAG: Rab family GTPase [Candidatus Heimdallarchaeota archaeon]